MWWFAAFVCFVSLFVNWTLLFSPAQLWMASTFFHHVLRPAPQLYSALCCFEAGRLTSPGSPRPCCPSPWLALLAPPADCQRSCCVWPSPQHPDLLRRAPALANPWPHLGSLPSYCAVGNVQGPWRCNSLLWKSDLRGHQCCPDPQSCCAALGAQGLRLRPTVRCSGSRHPGWTRCCSGPALRVKTWTCEVGVGEEHLYGKERLKWQKSGRKEDRGRVGC